MARFWPSLILAFSKKTRFGMNFIASKIAESPQKSIFEKLYVTLLITF
jgi:hypothetical protein